MHSKNVSSKDEVAGYLDVANEVIEHYEAENPKMCKASIYMIIQTLFRMDGIGGWIDHPNFFGIIFRLWILRSTCVIQVRAREIGRYGIPTLANHWCRFR